MMMSSMFSRLRNNKNLSQTDAQTTKTLATIAWTSSFAGKSRPILNLDLTHQLDCEILQMCESEVQSTKAKDIQNSLKRDI